MILISLGSISHYSKRGANALTTILPDEGMRHNIYYIQRVTIHEDNRKAWQHRNKTYPNDLEVQTKTRAPQSALPIRFTRALRPISSRRNRDPALRIQSHPFLPPLRHNQSGNVRPADARPLDTRSKLIHGPGVPEILLEAGLAVPQSWRQERVGRGRLLRVSRRETQYGWGDDIRNGDERC